jgi:DNA-binding transcriptional ArsR family regulator
LPRSSVSRDVYVAIADPTRRRILELLDERGTLPAGAIADAFANASRPGISRHLRILKECGVVDCTRTGKARIYRLNPQPLQRVRDGWLARFGTMQVDSLKALRRRAESPRGQR